MSSMQVSVFRVVGLVVCAAALAGCQTSAAQQARTPAPVDIVGSVGSKTFTLAQVDEKALQRPANHLGEMKPGQARH